MKEKGFTKEREKEGKKTGLDHNRSLKRRKAMREGKIEKENGKLSRLRLSLLTICYTFRERGRLS